jgi:hypothetical protein
MTKIATTVSVIVNFSPEPSQPIASPPAQDYDLERPEFVRFTPSNVKE